MSSQRHDSALYLGIKPRFPNGTEELNRAQGELKLGEAELESICRNLNGFEMVKYSFQTRDRYEWFAGIQFQLYNHTILIALPKNSTDRSCAVYARESIDDAVLERLLTQLVSALDAHSNE